MTIDDVGGDYYVEQDPTEPIFSQYDEFMESQAAKEFYATYESLYNSYKGYV